MRASSQRKSTEARAELERRAREDDRTLSAQVQRCAPSISRGATTRRPQCCSPRGRRGGARGITLRARWSTVPVVRVHRCCRVATSPQRVAAPDRAFSIVATPTNSPAPPLSLIVLRVIALAFAGPCVGGRSEHPPSAFVAKERRHAARERRSARSRAGRTSGSRRCGVGRRGSERGCPVP